jgi:hypothetical protein
MEAGDAVLVRIDENPDDWRTGASQSARDLAAQHLGVEHFFDCRFPDRRLSAPDFGLAELDRPGRTLQVLTADGKHFTVLPPTN